MVAAGPADAVAISMAARAHQKLDASVLALQRLGSLLERFDQVTSSATRSDPSTLLGLADEIGAAASRSARALPRGATDQVRLR